MCFTNKDFYYSVSNIIRTLDNNKDNIVLDNYVIYSFFKLLFFYLFLLKWYTYYVCMKMYYIYIYITLYIACVHKHRTISCISDLGVAIGYCIRNKKKIMQSQCKLQYIIVKRVWKLNKQMDTSATPEFYKRQLIFLFILYINSIGSYFLLDKLCILFFSL